MTDSQERRNPWWKTALTAFNRIVGLLAIVITLTPIFSADAKQWFKDQWLLGWLLSFAAVLISVVLLETRRKRQPISPPIPTPEVASEPEGNPRPDTRIGECKSDVALVDQWLVPFMNGGEFRLKLMEIPNEKLFSRQLSFALYQLNRDLNDSSKEVFDEDLRVSIKDMKDSFDAYWGSLEPLLDGPGELFGNPWDLKIMTPPGGNWAGDTKLKQWESFYVFVNALVPLKSTFLENVSAVEKVAHRLRIEADLPLRQ